VVFSVMNAFILRPLNVPNANSLYAIFRPDGSAYQSYPDYLDLRDRNHSFDGLVAYNIAEAGLNTGEVHRASGLRKPAGTTSTR